MAILHCNFFSKALMRPVPITVVLPTDKRVGPQGTPPAGPFKTLYLLHGIFGDETDWVCGTRAQAWATERNLALVMPAGENSFYVDHPNASRNYGQFIGEERWNSPAAPSPSPPSGRTPSSAGFRWAALGLLSTA